MINRYVNVRTRLLLACGALASSLFVVSFLLLGMFRPSWFLMRYTVSALAGGPLGFYQQANFFLSGFFLLIFVCGLRTVLEGMKGRIAVLILFSLAGIGLLGSGVFPAKMPGESVITITAFMHYGFAMLLFLSLPLACFIFMKRFREFHHTSMLIYSRYSLIGVLFFFVLMVLGIAGVPGFDAFTGLFQRISISIGFAWVAVLSIFLLRES